MPDSTTQFACGAAGKREADDPDQAASPGAIGATIQRLFTGRDRGRASGYLGGVVGISTAAGPLLGGVLSQAIGTHNDWRWVFLVNLFLGMVEVPVAIKLLPPPPNFPHISQWPGRSMS